MSMTFKHILLAILAAVAASGAQALDVAAARALATKSACMACHATESKLVGPSYKDIAAKRKGEVNAVVKVAARIKSGGSGVFGPVLMPAQPNLKDDELKLLAAWVLAGAPNQ